MPAANRNALTVIDPTGQGGPANNGRWPFELVPQDAGHHGRMIKITTRPWQPADPKDRWRIPLHPWAAGLRLDKVHQHVSPYSGMLINRVPETYASGPCDASPHGVLLPPPLVTTITLANGQTADRPPVDFNGAKYIIGGRYLYYYDPVSGKTVLDKDFGAGKSAQTGAVFLNQLWIAMGETEKIWYKSNTGLPISGTANAAVTTGATTLTDTRLALTVNAYIGSTVFSGGQALTVTSNTATVFTGTWDAQPSSNLAWNATGAGVWAQATDATYAIAFGAVATSSGPNVFYRAETQNQITSCTAAPQTLASWGPTPKYTVGDGDTNYPIHTLLSYGGALWALNGKGAWQADPQVRFKNQCPQMEKWPDPNNGKGTWLDSGWMFIPTVGGVYRIKPGESKGRGPEVTWRPNYRWRVRGGVPHQGCTYLIADDLAGVGNTCIIRMYADDTNITPENHDYIYHHLADLDRTTAGHFIGLTVLGTNPTLLFDNGTNVATITLDRGGQTNGIPSDPNYRWGTSATLTTGVMMPTTDMATVSNLVGTEIVCKAVNAGESLTLAYSIDDQTYQNFLTTQEGGGTAAIAGTTDYQAVTRYADPLRSEGQQMQFKLTGALTDTTKHWEVREWWVFGYSHSKTTDQLDLTIMADSQARPGGLIRGVSRAQIIQLWRSWVGAELQIEIEDYETSRRTRFVVASVGDTEADAHMSEGGQTSIMSHLAVTLIRVDRAGAYAT